MKLPVTPNTNIARFVGRNRCGSNAMARNLVFFFVRFFNLFAICIDTLKYNQQMVCWEARAGREVLCSTPL
jgi:hypothetical protein